MKRALVLGVVASQSDAIRYLISKGWYVIGCAHEKRGLGLDIVNQFELVDIKDTDAVEQLARDENVDIIYSVGSDLAVNTAVEVSSKMGLPYFVEPSVAGLIDNKVKFREFLNNHSISTVSYKRVKSKEELDSFEQFPAVIKPTDSYGQRGVFKVENKLEAKELFDTAAHHSSNGDVLIEEYLDGPEVSVNAFVEDSMVSFAVLSDRIVADESRGIPKAHVIPSDATKSCKEDVVSLVHQTVEALGITDGPLYYQLKLTNSGPKIIEMAPRLDGCHLWRLIKHSCGVDLLNATFQSLTGVQSNQLSVDSISPYRLEFFLETPDKPFDRGQYKIPEKREYSEFYYDSGDEVRATNSVLEKVGYYIVRDDQ